MIHNGNNEILTESNSLFEVTLLTNIGDREEQQDCFGCLLTKEGGLIVVCDGMGGYEGGRKASELATETFLSRFISVGVSTPIEFLISSAKDADSKVSKLRASNERLARCGSTGVVVLLVEGNLYWCSVGDSRAYLIRDGQFVQFTKDLNYRTVLEEKLSAGRISKQEFEIESIIGEALISYFGIGDLSLIDYSNMPFKLMSGDKILVTTDGLYRILSDADISDISMNFSNPEDAVKILKSKAEKTAQKKGISRDNTTFGIIKIK